MYLYWIPMLLEPKHLLYCQRTHPLRSPLLSSPLRLLLLFPPEISVPLRTSYNVIVIIATRPWPGLSKLFNYLKILDITNIFNGDRADSAFYFSSLYLLERVLEFGRGIDGFLFQRSHFCSLLIFWILKVILSFFSSLLYSPSKPELLLEITNSLN